LLNRPAIKRNSNVGARRGFQDRSPLATISAGAIEWSAKNEWLTLDFRRTAMIGWRGHLAKISPAPVAGRVVVPEGVDLTVGPLAVQTILRQSMADMMKAVGSATELLAEKGPKAAIDRIATVLADKAR
jgi:hypothetical protein